VAPVGHDKVTWTVIASDAGGNTLDSLKVVQNVIPAYPVRTYQATIAQLTGPIAIPAERPKGSIAGRGGLEVDLRAKLGDGTDGIREYMRFYSYTCLEQNISRAVVFRDRAMWDFWMQRLPAYMDRDGLLKYFPAETLEGEDALTAYVLAIAHEAGWQIPASSWQRLTNALTGFVEGRITRRSALPTADLTIRKLAAIDALSRYGNAQAVMLDSITIEPNLWPTSAIIDWLGILDRVKGIPNAAERRRFALNALRSRLNFQGTTMGFSTARTDALWWLMISEDSNAVRMLLAVLNEPAWREDIPRLVRGALFRQQRGHWNTTVANAWGVLALEKFSQAFEATPVTGATSVQFATEKKSVAWPREAGTDPVKLPWQPERATLDVKHQGTGSPWLMVRATAALPLDAPLSTGYKINRTVTPVTQAVAGRWTAGDVARIRLELEAQSDMSWVVVDDPIPGGSTALGSGLGGQSQILQRDERREGWVWPAFEERRFEAFRAYYRFVPKGKWTVEYTVRLNNPGTFLLPATRVEALYAPEMLGESPNANFTVEPRK
jgi:alpha-2-macroglobulin